MASLQIAVASQDIAHAYIRFRLYMFLGWYMLWTKCAYWLITSEGGYFVKKLGLVMLALCCAAGVMAGEIMVSFESNGVLRAEGMQPGTSYTVEWASQLEEGFTNNPAPFSGLVTDSNGVGIVSLPMFFRVVGTPDPVPQGMVRIPGGTNSGTDPDFGAYSLTVDSFYMDATEVTKAQWDSVYTWAVTNGYSFSNAGSGKAANHPVQTVNWYDCVKWCNARSEKEGKTPCYAVGGNVYKTGESAPVCNFVANGYRLPTSDEWEYAARGGLSGKRFPWGDTISHGSANYYGFSGSYDYDSSDGYHPSYSDGGQPYTSPVGSFAANGYGLYDMSGNVWEWCNTASGSSGSSRLIRGGGWSGGVYGARCGNERWDYPSYVYYAGGFRAVCR